MRMLWVSVLLALVPAAGAGIYKCQSDGGTVYQSSPCANGSGSEMKLQTRNVASPRQGDDEATGSYADKTGWGETSIRESESKYLVQRQIDSKELKIKKHKKKIKRYQWKMKSELAALRRKKGYANNNLAGATWEQSISTEMNAVAAKYRGLVDSEQEEIKRLREEITEFKR